MKFILHLLLALSLAGLSLAQDATKQLTNTHGEGVDTESERNAWKSSLEALGEIKSANFTAANNVAYVADATLTVTDPAGVEGKGFSVFVTAGTATVGGTAYATAGTIIRRFYEGAAWVSRAYTPDNSVAITGGTIAGITDLAVADGGTGASDATTARTNLGAVGLTGDETIAGAKTWSGAQTLNADLTVDTNVLKVDSANNRVGIGTASPAVKLDINVGAAQDGINVFGSVLPLIQVGANSSECFQQYWSGGSGVLGTSGGISPLLFNGSYLRAQTGGVERLRIINNGNVGIGVTAPSTALDINGTISFEANSGTWNGSTVAGDQSFSGNVTITGTATASNFKRGAGSPEGAVTGSVGDLYTRTDGGANTTLYVKESGAATNTGWIAK